MSTEQVPGADGCVSFKVSATSLAAKQYMGVKLSAANTVAIGDANGDLVVGILQNKPPANGTARVFTAGGGICKVYAGAAVATVGTPLTTNASGHLVGASDNDIILGYALETAGAAGDIISMLYIGAHQCTNVSFYTTAS